MKKRIAVFAGGWGGEYFREVVLGIVKAAKENNADVFAFVNFSVPADTITPNIGEFNIFTLPDLQDFDGAILLANSFNMHEEVEYLTHKVKKLGIPAVSVEYDIEGMTTVFSDNYSGMYDLSKHIIEEHGARNILFIGGPKEHPESALRLKALQDVAKENNIIIPESNIRFGDWSKAPAMKLVAGWIEDNGVHPDAVICANDIMAMAVCEQLDKSGYSVPEDVMVTGYDCLTDARKFNPSITTVNHEWGKMGETALKMLSDMLQGIRVENRLLKSSLIIGGSCGCVTEEEPNVSKSNNRKCERRYEMDGLAMDSHFRHMYLAVRKIETKENMTYSLSYLFQENHNIEGEDFMLCLDPEFFRIEDNDSNLRSQGYSDNVDIVCLLSDGKSRPVSSIKRKDALFVTADSKKEPGLYMYVPIYSDTKTYGFAMLTGDLRIACGNPLYIWTRHMNQSMEHVRDNIIIAELTRRLTKLSVTDVLTGIYNRAGCEKIAFPMLEEWRNSGGTGVVMLVDIDRMKVINDGYGHENGDLALCTVASVLKNGVPADWIVSRFGGDEFFIGGKVITDEIDFETFKNRVYDELEQESIRRRVPFKLSISIGMAFVRPDESEAIEKYLQMADADMYREKDKHHSDMDNN